MSQQLLVNFTIGYFPTKRSLPHKYKTQLVVTYLLSKFWIDSALVGIQCKCLQTKLTTDVNVQSVIIKPKGSECLIGIRALFAKIQGLNVFNTCEILSLLRRKIWPHVRSRQYLLLGVQIDSSPANQSFQTLMLPVDYTISAQQQINKQKWVCGGYSF